MRLDPDMFLIPYSYTNIPIRERQGPLGGVALVGGKTWGIAIYCIPYTFLKNGSRGESLGPFLLFHRKGSAAHEAHLKRKVQKRSLRPSLESMKLNEPVIFL